MRPSLEDIEPPTPVGPPLAPVTSRLGPAGVWMRRHPVAVTVIGSLVVAVALAVGLWGKREDFVDAFVSHTRKIVVGDPMDPNTDVGPLVRAIQRDRVEAQLASAKGAGARIAFGGERGDFDTGYFLVPAVVLDVEESMDVMRQETFGPVAPIARVSSLEEAIERTNASEYGLGANVYTRRLDYMLTAMEEIEAGTVWFNDPLTDNEAAPFGGFKSSGNGRELGIEGLDDFRATKHVHIDTKMESKAWWYPYAEYVQHQAEHGTAPG